MAIEARPEQDRDDRAEEDDQTAHRRRGTLRLMRIRRAFANDLMVRFAAQLSQDRRTDDERQQQGRHGRSSRAERDVVENVQDGELSDERDEQEIEHE